MGARHPPFDSPLVRQAFALAADRSKMANIDMRDNFFPAMGGFVPPAMPGHAPDITLSSNLDEGRRLLTEGGYPGGKGFPEVGMVTSLGRKYLAEVLVEQWREKLGVKVQVLGYKPGELFPRYRDANMVFGLWVADYPDPDC